MKQLRVILLSLLLIGGLSFFGWRYWNQNRSEPTQTNNSTQQVNNDPSEGGKYLVIKEWKMRFPLPEEVRGDVKHGVFMFNNGDQATYFASKKLAAKSDDGLCDLEELNESYGKGVFGGTIAVTRSRTKPDYPDFRKDEYWYAVEASNGGACFEGDGGQEKGRFNSLMHGAIEKLEYLE